MQIQNAGRWKSCVVACASIVGFGGCHTKSFRFCIHAGSGLRFFTSLMLRLRYASLNSLSRVRTYGPNRASAVAHTDSTDLVFTSVELLEGKDDDVEEGAANETADEAVDEGADEGADEDVDEDVDEDADCHNNIVL